MKKLKNITELGISAGKRVLPVFPHPDDETAFTAGFMMAALAAGAELRLLILTKGEASTLRNGVEVGHNLGNVRESELNAVADRLKIKNRKIFDLPDGRLAAEPNRLRMLFLHELAVFKPDFVVTYEPGGVYGHPDLIALSKTITEVHAERPSFKLIYATVGLGHKHSRDSLKMAADPAAVLPIPPQFFLQLNLRQALEKLYLMRLHKSQVKPGFGDVLLWFWNRLWDREFFSVK